MLVLLAGEAGSSWAPVTADLDLVDLSLEVRRTSWGGRIVSARGSLRTLLGKAFAKGEVVEGPKATDFGLRDVRQVLVNSSCSY